MESIGGPRPKSINKWMSDPILLELKMAGYSEESAGICVTKKTGQGPPIIRSTPSSAECQKSAATRSGRCVRLASYLKDYVQT